MWVQISAEEACRILLTGGKTDAGFYRWGGTLTLRCPAQWRKARKRKSLLRKLKGKWYSDCDGWWVYR